MHLQSDKCSQTDDYLELIATYAIKLITDRLAVYLLQERRET